MTGKGTMYTQIFMFIERGMNDEKCRCFLFSFFCQKELPPFLAFNLTYFGRIGGSVSEMGEGWILNFQEQIKTGSKALWCCSRLGFSSDGCLIADACA